MQFSETCSRQSLIFSSPKYNYVSMCIVMQKKFKKSHKQKTKCYGFDCEIFEKRAQNLPILRRRFGPFILFTGA